MSSVTQHSLHLWFVRFGVYALLATPLIFWKPLDFGMDSAKALFVMAIAQVTFAAYLWLAWRDPQWRPKVSVVGVALVGYVVVFFLASIFGVDPFLSFWASTDRIMGGLFWLHLLAVFIVASSVFPKKEDWAEVCLLETLVGLVVVFVFFLSRLDPVAFFYMKIGSTLGNSSYLGTYLIIAAFWSAMLGNLHISKRMRRFGWIACAVFVATLFFTEATAAMFATMGGLLFALALWWAMSRRVQWRRVGLSLLLSMAVVFFLFWTQLFQEGSGAQRWFLAHTGRARLVVWDIAWEGIQERPWLGWGPESFPVVFAKYSNPCLGSAACGPEVWFDRAHNKVLDTLVETGVLGLLAYVSVFAVSVFALWKAYRRGDISRTMVVTILTFFAVYVVQNLSGFDVPFTLLFFVLSMGFVHSVLPSRSLTTTRAPWLVVAVLFTLALPFTLSHAVVFPFATNQSERIMNATSMDERLKDYEASVFGSPIGIDFRRVTLTGETAKLHAQLPSSQREQRKPKLKRELEMGQQALLLTIQRAPNDQRAVNMFALLSVWSVLYHEDASDLPQAEALINEAIARNPSNPQPLQALAGVRLAQGKGDDALALLDQVMRMDEQVPGSHIDRLAALVILDRQAEAQAAATQILEAFPATSADVHTILTAETPDELLRLYAFFY